MARESKADQRYRLLVADRTRALLDAGHLGYHEGETSDYFYRPAELCVSVAALDVLADQLHDLGAVELERPDGLGMVSLRLPAQHDVHETVQLLRKDGGVGADAVGPHHVLFGAPRMHGCPGRPPSAGVPVDPPADEHAGKGVLIAVLDTGQAEESLGGAWAAAHVRPGAELDRLDTDGDGRLDFIAGHGTFVTGIISQIAPGAQVLVLAPLTPQGITDDLTAAKAVLQARQQGATVLNLSFGGYTDSDAPPLALLGALSGSQDPQAPVAVAAAGNDGGSRPFYPAALPGVIAVAALNASGRRSGFSNFGDWVEACASGDRILSTFVTGEVETDSDGDGSPDVFQDPWAYWSGTSFAAPQVAAALAVRMSETGETAQEAAQSLVRAVTNVRRPGIGTHVPTAVPSHRSAPGRP